MYAVDRLQHRALIALLPVVAADQVAVPSAISNRTCMRMDRSGSDRTKASRPFLARFRISSLA